MCAQPAYDLIFSTGPGGEQTMTLAGEGRQPMREHILNLAAQSGLKPAVASQVIDDVNGANGKWPAFAAQAGCAAKSMRTIKPALRPV